MKSYKMLSTVFIASLTLSGCASNSMCHVAFDVTEGAMDNYDKRQERERRDPYTMSDGKFKDEDLAVGALTAGIRGIARLFQSEPNQKCP